MPNICLNMIVKNEAHVIRRCLESVKPHISSWCIVDTGSTDGTQDIIREAMQGLHGELHEHPWVNFGHNRTEAIGCAEGVASLQDCNEFTYLLFIDADEVLEVDAEWPELTAACYHIKHVLNGLEYMRASLASLHLDWKFKGVVHEYLHCDEPFRTEMLEGVRIMVHQDGARSQNPHKFLDDANLLCAAIDRGEDVVRNTFYLAQSYRDAGRPLLAIDNYENRVEMGGWDEEVWYSKLQIALLDCEGAHDTIPEFLDTYEFRPSRPETLGYLARYCRLQKKYHLAYLFAKQAVATPQTDDLLFVDPSFAEWRNEDEYAVACYWTGQYAESRYHCLRLLTLGSLPDSERDRVEKNLKFAEEKMNAPQ